MDEHIATILEIAGWAGGIIALVYGGTLVWLIKRLLKLEDAMTLDVHAVVKDVAVLERGQKDFLEEWKRAEKRNNEDHKKIMTRLDNVIDVVKNGG